MNRMKGILAAGTLTGLLLVTGLAFGFGKSDKEVVSETAVPQEIPETIVNPIVIPEEPVENVWVKTGANTETAVSGNADEQSIYTQQLESALQTMQAREAEYRTQIDTANQTILQLQDRVNSQITASASSNYTEYEDDEYGEYEDNDDDDSGEYEYDNDEGEYDDD